MSPFGGQKNAEQCRRAIIGRDLVMKKLGYLLIFAGFSLAPICSYSQSGISTDVGDTSFYNFGGITGTRQPIGDSDFYGFSNGSTTTRNGIGNTDFYSGSTPSLSGLTNRIGGTTFGTWQDGKTSTHQSVGGTTFS